MDENLSSYSGSAAHNQNGGQSAVLDLLCAQINAALEEVSQSESMVIEFFNHTRYQVDGLVEWIDAMEEKTLETATAHASLLSIKNAAASSIQDLQSFDRVAQRLRHVMENLEQLSQAADLNAPHLIDLFEESYSLEHEHKLIKLARAGASKQQLIDSAVIESSQTGDSELF